jgi:hypothetical protein
MAKYTHSESAPIAAANLNFTCLDPTSLYVARVDKADVSLDNIGETIGPKERSRTS